MGLVELAPVGVTGRQCPREQNAEGTTGYGISPRSQDAYVPFVDSMIEVLGARSWHSDLLCQREAVCQGKKQRPIPEANHALLVVSFKHLSCLPTPLRHAESEPTLWTYLKRLVVTLAAMQNRVQSSSTLPIAPSTRRLLPARPPQSVRSGLVANESAVLLPRRKAHSTAACETCRKRKVKVNQEPLEALQQLFCPDTSSTC